MYAKKINDKKYISLLFWVCWITYFSTYLGRLNYNAVMVEMIGEGFVNKIQAGFTGTCYFFAYGIGQLASGFLADKSKPQKVMLVGLISSAIINFLMGRIQAASLMPVLWGLNGFALSLTWCPIMRLFAERLLKKDRITVSVHFGTCAVAGLFGSYLMSSAVVYFTSWRWVFFAASFILIISAVLWTFGIKKVLNYADKYGVTEAEDEHAVNDSLRDFGGILLASGVIIALPVVAIHGALRDGITTWIPTFLTEQYSIKSYSSILLTAVLPVINLFGVYLGSYVNKRFIKNEMLSSAVFYIASVFSVIGLLVFRNIILSLVFLIAITTSMYAINILTIGIMPLKFAKYGRAATVTGIMNSLSYLGCAVSTYGISIATQYKGWSFTVMLWCVLAVIGVLCSFSGVKKWHRFNK